MIVCAKFPALARPRQSLSAEGNDIYNISTTESPLSVTYQPRARQRTLRAAYFLSSDAERKHHPGQGVAVVALFVHGQGATEFRERIALQQPHPARDGAFFRRQS